MKNTLSDLNNHLFEQLERLNNEDLSEEQLDREPRSFVLRGSFPIFRQTIDWTGTFYRLPA